MRKFNSSGILKFVITVNACLCAHNFLMRVLRSYVKNMHKKGWSYKQAISLVLLSYILINYILIKAGKNLCREELTSYLQSLKILTSLT